MASSQPQTVTGQKATAEKKPFSTFVDVDVYTAGLGFADDLAEAAAERQALKTPQSSTTPKVS